MSAQENSIFEGFDDLFKDLGNAPEVVDIEKDNAPIKEEKDVTVTPASKESFTVQKTDTATLVQGAQAKLSLIEREMNDCYVERDEVIKCMLLALVSGQSMLMLGMPGTARIDIIA